MHAPLILADGGWTGWWIRRFQLERPVGTVAVVVLDVDAEHLLKVSSPGDQQPVQALGPHHTDPALGVGVGVGRLHRRDQYLGAVRTEDVVEGAGELGIRSRTRKRTRWPARPARGAGCGPAGQPKPHPGGRSGTVASGPKVRLAGSKVELLPVQ